MKTIRLKSPRFCRDVGEVLLKESACKFTKNEGPSAGAHAVRLFHVHRVDGASLLEYVRRWPFMMAEQAPTKDVDMYLRLGALLGCDVVYDDLDPTHRRRFVLDTFDYADGLRALRTDPRLLRKSSLECLDLLDFSGEAPSADLVGPALYVTPDFRIPLSVDEYIGFRDMTLDSIVNGLEVFSEVGRKALLKTRRRMTKAEREQKLDTLVNKGMEMLLADALTEELRVSLAFEPLVERARTLLSPVIAAFAGSGLPTPLTSQTSWSRDEIRCIDRALDATAATALLREASRQHALLYPAVGRTDRWHREQVDSSVMAPMTKGVKARERIIREQARALDRAISSQRRLLKYTALMWLATSMCDRTECLRLLHREAEAATHEIAEQVLIDIYRALRPELTAIERRAFAFMHFRLPSLDHRVVSLTPVFYSFFTGGGSMIARLIGLRTACRRGRDAFDDSGMQMLEHLWRSYLAFYPFWLELVRESDLDGIVTLRPTDLEKEKRGTRAAPPETSPDVEAASPDTESKTVLEVLLEKDGGKTIEEWTRTYCSTPRQVECILGRFLHRKTEAAMAAELDVSQQAVSNAIQRGMARIRKGLLRDLNLEAEGVVFPDPRAVRVRGHGSKRAR